MCLEPNRNEKTFESKKASSSDSCFSTKPYIKIFMGTVLIGLSILSPLPAAAQTNTHVVVSYSTEEKAPLVITEQFKDLNGNSLYPDRIDNNQISYPPAIPGYWIVPEKSSWSTENMEEIPLSSFLGYVDPAKGDPLTQVIDLLNDNIKDTADTGAANFTFVYGKDLSSFEGKTLTIPIGTKITIPELVGELRNVDGSEGDPNQVVAEDPSAITTEKEGTFPVKLLYYDQKHFKVMKTTAYLNVTANQPVLKGKNIKLTAGSNFDKNAVIEQIINSDGSSGNPADVQVIGNVDTNHAGTYPLTLRYVDPITSKTVETTVTVTIEEMSPEITLITRFVDAETNQELSPSMIKMISVSEGLPEIPVPVDIQGMVPNTEYSTFERNKKRISIYDYIRQNGLGDNIYWKDVAQHLQTEMQVGRDVPYEMVVTYAYTKDKSSFSVNDLVVEEENTVEKTQLLKEARDTEGYFLDKEFVTTSIDGKSFTEYQPQKPGKYEVDYSYHDPISLQDIHASSQLVVLPKSEQKNTAVRPTTVQPEIPSKESAKAAAEKTKESADEETVPNNQLKLSKSSAGKENESKIINGRPINLINKKQPDNPQEKSGEKLAAGINSNTDRLDEKNESSVKKKHRKEDYNPEPKKHVTSPSQGGPAPGGGGTEASQLGDLMRGIAGTFVYSDRNPFDVDNWS
jgi:hypothetical protein